MNAFNKNEKQHNFNQIKGKIIEINDGDYVKLMWQA